MLSSAHVLAMDAKNLLDVVDSLRKRYPELFPAVGATVAAPMPPTTQPSPQQQPPPPSNRFQFDPVPLPVGNHADENYQIMTRQSYQNTPAQQQQHSPDDPGELYSNQAAIGANQSPSASVAAAAAATGIYDNDPAHCKQMAAMQLDTGSMGAAASVSASAPPKPPVAAKPSNLQQKLKRQQLPLPREALPLPAGEQPPLNEPLRIVEETDANAPGAIAAAAAAADANTQLYSNMGLGGLQLPEPAACAIVQENVFQKVMSNKMA